MNKYLERIDGVYADVNECESMAQYIEDNMAKTIVRDLCGAVKRLTVLIEEIVEENNNDM